MAEQPVYGTPEKGDPGNSPELRELAMKRLRAKQGFYVHATAYALVNTLLVATWVAVGISADVWFPWPIFPIFGWGLGLAMHAWGVYGGHLLREDRVQREMERLARRTRSQRGLD